MHKPVVCLYRKLYLFATMAKKITPKFGKNLFRVKRKQSICVKVSGNYSIYILGTIGIILRNSII